MNTNKLYSGRKVDMSTYPAKSGSSPQLLGFGSMPALAIAGSLKASQNFLRMLLSSKGERREDPEFGSEFSSGLSSSNLVHPIQVYQIFSRSAVRILRKLSEEYTDDTPDDEKIKSAELILFNMSSPTSIELDIEITMDSEEEMSFLLPVPV